MLDSQKDLNWEKQAEDPNEYRIPPYAGQILELTKTQIAGFKRTKFRIENKRYVAAVDGCKVGHAELLCANYHVVQY